MAIKKSCASNSATWLKQLETNNDHHIVCDRGPPYLISLISKVSIWSLNILLS